MLLRIALMLFIPLGVALVTFLFMYAAFLRPAEPGATRTVLIEVAPGSRFSDISAQLKDKALIRYAWTLNLLAQFRKADTQVKAGEYEISPGMSSRQILDRLVSGDILKRLVTVRPGMSIWEVGTELQNKGVLSADEFNASLSDPALLARAGISAPSFEGYLYPETYQLSRPITVWQVLLRMIEEGERNWPPEFTSRADEMRLSRHEVLTLASIIEKEAGNQEEMPIISSVFHNRYSRGMPLQADPTVIYGIKDFDGNLKKEHLTDPHAYNTYVHVGLPPGPICNPGMNSIKAALFPADTTFLYFVADGTGKHVFSTTYQEHQENVNRYQRGK